jgi:carboxyl-terminal processing protease
VSAVGVRDRPGRVLVVGVAIVAALSTAGGVVALSFRGAGHATAIASGPSAATASMAAPCARQAVPTSPPPTLTTITTLQQAYHCILAHYYGGPVLDDRTLLAAAFAGFTQELQRRGQDQPTATLAALTGNRDRDWAAFSAVYQQVASKLPADPRLRQALAAAAMHAMVASLDDNHARWVRSLRPPGANANDAYGLGIAGLSGVQGATADPVATPPLFVTSVLAGSPAARQGVRPGDLIVAVNGAPPFAGGVLSQGVLDWLNQQYPQRQTVRLRLRRPSTGRTWTAAITPALFPAASPTVSARLLRGDVAYLKLPEFFPGAADQVLRAIAGLRNGRTLGGAILDLRGNGRGGAPAEVARLLGAFAHGKITSYDCDVRGTCTPNRTDDTVPLLGLRLVALIDRGCASACEDFSAAVKDLGLGALVGTRTAGGVAGPATSWLLDDNSLLRLPERHHLGANKELINTIGVAADHHAPLTAYDLSSGRDPAVATALRLLP